MMLLHEKLLLIIRKSFERRKIVDGNRPSHIIPFINNATRYYPSEIVAGGQETEAST
jgi:hypothetical protein